MIGCDETAAVTAAEVGDKAAQLLELYRLSLDSSFAVPRFSLLPAALLADYHRDRGWRPTLRYPPVPRPDDVPAGVEAGLNGFAGFAAVAVDDCVRRVDAPLILRSSLVLPAGTPPEADSGCNSTRMAAGTEPVGADGAPLVPRLLAAFYKAFTSWSLDPGLDWQVRTGGIVFMEAVPFRCLGAVCVTAGGLAVEVDGKYPLVRERCLCDPAGVPWYRTDTGVLSPADLRALALACREVVDRYGDAGAMVEVEFGFGLEDGRLYVVQARGFADRPGGGFRAGPFHSIGTAAGTLRDLRAAPRSAAAVRRPAGGAPEVLLMSRDAPTRFDCFAYAWSRAADPTLLAGTVALLLEDTGAVAWGAGFRNHLTRSLMRRCPDLFVGQLRVGDMADPTGWTRMRADGTRLDVARESVAPSGRTTRRDAT